MTIREATINDYEQVWDIFSAVITKGDTYTFDPATPKSELAAYWFAPYMKTFVMEDGENILGTYVLKPNQPGLGSHIANGAYMVHPAARGKGIGKLLCGHSIETARQLGYKAMQFNIVISTNTVAVALWQKFGFQIIGTIPNGFRHLQLGFVDAYIMYKEL
ncbi:GNAT family N-acetyltransferase [soil metagenome]|jgi:L-amino acid N-acyltransferase YncA